MEEEAVHPSRYMDAVTFELKTGDVLELLLVNDIRDKIVYNLIGYLQKYDLEVTNEKRRYKIY